MNLTTKNEKLHLQAKRSRKLILEALNTAQDAMNIMNDMGGIDSEETWDLKVGKARNKAERLGRVEKKL